jgi:hypothetical protein
MISVKEMDEGMAAVTELPPAEFKVDLIKVYELVKKKHPPMPDRKDTMELLDLIERENSGPHE